MQFLAQHGEIAVVGRMQQANREPRPPDMNHIFDAQIDRHLPITVRTRVDGLKNANFNLAAVADQDRAIGQ